MDSFIHFLQDRILPPESKKARKVRHQASRYIIYEGKLYKWSFSPPLLKYLHPSKANYTLREMHEGICENHLDGKSLAYKLLQ